MKIFCIGRNYVDHAKELNNPVPSQPLVFMKPASALVKDGSPFYYPEFSKDIHFECEIVLKMGRAGKSIPHCMAIEMIDEITLGIDYTARDIQKKCKEKGHPWEIAKAFDYSAPVGIFSDFKEFENKDIEFRLEKNGTVVQNGKSSEMIFDFATLIVHLSNYFTLKKGDLIFTGTPAGVGPVEKGDILEGFLMNQKVLTSLIK